MLVGVLGHFNDETFHIWDILWPPPPNFICKNPSAIFEKKVCILETALRFCRFFKSLYPLDRVTHKEFILLSYINGSLQLYTFFPTSKSFKYHLKNIFNLQIGIL